MLGINGLTQEYNINESKQKAMRAVIEEIHHNICKTIRTCNMKTKQKAKKAVVSKLKAYVKWKKLVEQNSRADLRLRRLIHPQNQDFLISLN